jgi:putative ABC transport system permease protein
MNTALLRFGRRQLRTRPGRALLTLISIIMGVAAIAAVEMVAESTRGASQKMFATVAGHSALTVQAPADTPIDQSLVETVEKVEGVEVAAPVIQRAVSLFTGEGDDKAKTRGLVMGVDPVRDQELRDHELAAGRFAQEGDEIVLEENFARARHVNLGDEVRLLGGGIIPKRLEVVGLVRSTSYARATAGGLAFIPLTTAQDYFFRGRRQVTAIQVVLKPNVKEAAAAQRINAVLPEGVRAEVPSMRTAVLEQTLFPTERGLDIAVVFVALLAAFIVFNTFMMNVSERRRQFAIVRAVGGTRRQLFGILLLESLFMGTLGTALGLLVGWWGAVALTRTLGRVLEVDLPIAQLTWYVAVEAVLFGLGIALMGVMYPAWRASRLTPLEAMNPLAQQDEERSEILPIVAGALLIAVGATLLYLTMNQYLPVEWGIYPALLMLLGMVVLFETLLINSVTSTVSRMLRPLFGVAASLADRQVIHHQTRSALTSGVIFIAVATGIALSWVILDTVGNIRNWYNKTIIGDFYIRVALPDFATGESPETPAEFDEKLNRVKHVESIDRARIVKSKINGVETMVGAREYPTDQHASFDMVEGERDPAKLRQQLLNGEVLVSSVVAAKAHLHAGDTATLDTPNGPQEVKVAGITNEYLVGGLMVWMHRKTAEKLLNISGYDGYIVMAEPGKQEEVRRQLEPLTQQYGLLLQSFTQIRNTVDGIIRASDGLLWTLVILEFIVASFGMVNTLTMSVLEQTRELGMLRIVAMTRAQVRRTIMAQALIIGLMGIVPGILVGLLIAYLMNMATMASISHPVQFGYHPWLIVGTAVGSLLLVIGAALPPALRAARIDVLKALQYE